MNEDSSKRFFHFTLGPVQGFVAQARRTRDFWAGSFILSWLSAVAMREVIAQHPNCLKDGQEFDCIRFPKPDPIFMKWLDGTMNGTSGPAQANIPNRFTAIVESNWFNPHKVEEAVRSAWRGLAEQVWQMDLKPLCMDASKLTTKRIWERQRDGFWEIAWALVADETDTAVLDRRKNWRSHLPPEEPGIKCMVMDGWQELSAAESPGRTVPGLSDKTRIGAFWEDVRRPKKLDDPIRRDLRDREHLCTLAFIKRRFPRHFDKVRVTMPSGWTAYGWRVPQTVPSVVYLAAVPWLAEVITYGDPEILKDFHDKASALTRVADEWSAHDERPTDIKRIRNAVAKTGRSEIENFRALEGGVFFDSSLADESRYEDQDQAKQVRAALSELQHQTGNRYASPFYAMLLMDGDDIGKHMSSLSIQPAITQGLAIFTDRVSTVVYDHDGFLIYAGGDDVLALLPIDTALDCAFILSETFTAAFKEAFDACQTPDPDRFKATLSGAIEFAHMKTPLTRTIMDSHDLLDRVAKDGRGRDAIACRVWKPGHMALEWAIPWEKAVDDHRVVVQELAQAFRNREDIEPTFASRFFYRIRERLELLQPTKAGKSELDEREAIQLMTAEYLGSGLYEAQETDKRISTVQAEELVGRLLSQCQRWTRISVAGGGYACQSERRWEADGALLVRFLAQKGVER
jgi:CRISPR-associated protein Cmr2